MECVGIKGLSQKNIYRICELIISWEGKLTWSRLVSKIAKNLNIRVSRQTLNGYFAIKKEFDVRKQQIRDGNENYRVMTNKNLSERDMLLKIDNQQRKIESLERQVNKQLDQLKTFIFNVRNIPNIDIADLHIRKERT